MIDEEANEDGVKQFDKLYTPSEEEPSIDTEDHSSIDNQKSENTDSVVSQFLSQFFLITFSIMSSLFIRQTILQ